MNGFDQPVTAAVLKLAAAWPGCLSDLTGAAPERHPDFRRFVAPLREAGSPVQLRTNLTARCLKGGAKLPFRRRPLKKIPLSP